jgi:flavodoxin
MKSLVVYYSRSGNTRKVAEKIAKTIGADSDEIIELKDRSGIRGWLGGCKDTFFRKPTAIKNNINPEKYDLVVIGTPIWVGTMTPAVKVYLKKYFLKKKVAFFCTAGDKQKSAFREMQELSKKPLVTLDLRDKNIDSSDKEIKEFCKSLR